MSAEHPDVSSDMPPLKIDPARSSTLLQNISSIHTRISSTCKSHNISKVPRLVAVSKLKPATDILALHQPSADQPSPPPPQLHFGENYVQELLEKSKLLPQSIKWHFIGGLQSNKCAQLAKNVHSLWAVESVDSAKKAQLLDKGRGQRNEELKKEQDGNGAADAEEMLRVFVQVNTSGEESKSGVEPKSEDLVNLCKTIREECSNLKLQGLMTIGAIARSKATTPETENEDFVNLRENRDWVAKELGVDSEELELSMGMSEDFESAIRQGSDEVRVGSTIFGERPPKSEAKVLENTEDGKK
ncbi:hypothetical protein LTR70_002862 [Exophiala xenobiotica]|uniref:Pyridoxal phosphate homeostasis protein n=1 Tax=Lithohypha guttulata TaxID=1690604 RepID=A0ABR0KJ29_9EURO|nr:hypothetical protein LTR24_002076 [Lithohypha guttulata]KAK5324578.1 hypothetical protein LTR70_002862 [Exophiala xenobiotica]